MEFYEKSTRLQSYVGLINLYDYDTFLFSSAPLIPLVILVSLVLLILLVP